MRGVSRDQHRTRAPNLQKLRVRITRRITQAYYRFSRQYDTIFYFGDYPWPQGLVSSLFLAEHKFEQFICSVSGIIHSNKDPFRLLSSPSMYLI